MIIKNFITTGFQPRRGGGFWHLLIAWHRHWRFAFVKPAAKIGYRRLYIGPIEIEWSRT